MYDSVRRRGGVERPADAHARRVPAESHRGTARDYLSRHGRESATAARGTRRQRDAFAAGLLRRATDPRSLFLALDHLARSGGAAPGPDGLRPDDLSPAERWDLARALPGAIRSGTYRPGPHRLVKIPKGGDRGYRALQIPNSATAPCSAPSSRSVNRSSTRGSRPGRSGSGLAKAGSRRWPWPRRWR